MSEQVDSVTNEHILEIRYKPNPKILDHRGTWADTISSHMDLRHWRVIENRVDLFSEQQREHVFVGFRNAGFTASDTPTKNFFPDKATKLFRFLLELDGFGPALHVERFGVRSRFCTRFEGSFEELMQRVATKYLALTGQAKEAVGKNAKLIDIASPLNFVDKVGNFNTTSGPMLKTQLAEHFRKDSGFPEVGLFYDIDYFLRPNREMSDKEILSTISSFAEAGWERHDRVCALIVGSY